MGRHRVVYPKVDYRLRVAALALLVAVAVTATLGTVTVAVSTGSMPTPLDSYVLDPPSRAPEP